MRAKEKGLGIPPCLLPLAGKRDEGSNQLSRAPSRLTCHVPPHAKCMHLTSQGPHGHPERGAALIPILLTRTLSPGHLPRVSRLVSGEASIHTQSDSRMSDV